MSDLLGGNDEVDGCERPPMILPLPLPTLLSEATPDPACQNRSLYTCMLLISSSAHHTSGNRISPHHQHHLHTCLAWTKACSRSLRTTMMDPLRSNIGACDMQQPSVHEASFHFSLFAQINSCVYMHVFLCESMRMLIQSVCMQI
jgi:hypothetical protein